MLEGSIDRSLPDATLTILQLEAWMAELAAEIDRTAPALDELGLGTAVMVGADRSAARR